MATYTGLFTVGRDAEVRTTQSGTAAVTLSLATNYGQKGIDGKKPTQWIRATVWGKMGEALAPYLTKGKQIYAVIEDLHIAEFEGQNGTKSSLEGKVTSIDFARDGSSGGQQAQQPAKPQRQQAPAPRAGSGFDDMDDQDIPFLDPLKSRAFAMAI